MIVVHSPDPKLFEQAIFILRDEAVTAGVTEEALLKEAKRLIHSPRAGDGKRRGFAGPAWACVGAMLTGIVWLITVLL